MAAVTRSAILVALLAVVSAAASAAPVDMSRDEIMSLAASGEGYSYWWGNGCWRTDGTGLGSCSGSCPDCSHSGSYGADCSGFVAKVWQVPDPSPVSTCAHPYSTQDFACTETWWTVISRDAMLRGDAAAYRSGGCPGSSGHVVLYESGDPWGSIWTYEARGCATGIVHNSRTLTSEYVAIRRDRLTTTCTDADGDTSCVPDDCNDGDPAVHPGAAEACGNGVDDDCDGATDEGCACTDADGDGFCPPDDCDDGNPDVSPGSLEVCGNVIDDDCDDLTDEGCGCPDEDGDGVCVPDDCDDGDPNIYPGAPEACGNLVDDDCDMLTDEDCDCVDADGDGFCPPVDCNDADPAVRPGASEVCGNGIDENCDGTTDEDCDCIDADGDGYCLPEDCNDNDPAIHPGATTGCLPRHDDDCDTRLDDDEPPCPVPDGSDGCGCRAGGSAAGPALLGLLGIFAVARRRRRTN
jgi:MYXO-CTERM domain-containing protein